MSCVSKSLLIYKLGIILSAENIGKWKWLPRSVRTFLIGNQVNCVLQRHTCSASFPFQNGIDIGVYRYWCRGHCVWVLAAKNPRTQTQKKKKKLCSFATLICSNGKSSTAHHASKRGKLLTSKPTYQNSVFIN